MSEKEKLILEIKQRIEELKQEIKEKEKILADLIEQLDEIND